MNHGAIPKVICFQYSIPPNDIEMTHIQKDPFVAILKAGIAIAFNKTLQLRYLDIELEGPAVAVA